MPEINLLKNELKSQSPFSGKAGLLSLYVVIGALVLEALVFIGFGLYEGSLKRQVVVAQQEGAAIGFELSSIETERLEAISFQERLSNLKILLDSQVFWSPLFEELEENTLSSVFFRTLQVSEVDKKINVTGIVSNYTDLAKLIRGLEQSPDIVEVFLNSSGLTESELAGYRFSLEIRFDPELLEK